MGTRSLTYVYETYKNDKGQPVSEPLVCMYRQFDGYPSGHGADLAEFLNGMTVVNGLGLEENRKVANGMGCLAAQLVAFFKDGPGGFYLHKPVLGRDDWQEFEYHVYADKVVVVNIGSNNDNVMFDGSWADFGQYCVPESVAA